MQSHGIHDETTNQMGDAYVGAINGQKHGKYVGWQHEEQATANHLRIEASALPKK